ncbi:MAG TPA: single-stranded DNA-binding protein [Chthoniobacterales bacterium]
MFLNEVKLVGNLTSDPQLRGTPKGHQLADIRLGVNETYDTEAGERRQVSTFVDVRVWGPSAQALARLARKGQELFVEGKIREFRWEDAETGENRSKLYLKAERWQFTQYRPKDQTPRGWDQIEGGEETPKAQPEPDAPAPQPAAETPAPEPVAAVAEPAPAPAAKPKLFRRPAKKVAA